MKSRYPGVQHMTFSELEEFTRRLFERLGVREGGWLRSENTGYDAGYVRNSIAEIFIQMVREQTEDDDGNRH